MVKHKIHSKKWKRFKEEIKRICSKNWKKVNGVTRYYMLRPYYKDVK